MRRMESRDLQEPRASDVLWSYGAGSCITASKPARRFPLWPFALAGVAMVAWGACSESDVRTAYNTPRCVQTRFGDCEERP